MYFIEQKIGKTWVWFIKTPDMHTAHSAYSAHRAKGHEVRLRVEQ